MLLAIRDRATGIIAWIIVILLIIPFALWGIQEYKGGGEVASVAEVNGIAISRNVLEDAYQDRVRRLEERPQGEAALAHKRAVLDRIIEQQLVLHMAEDQGMRIGDDRLSAHIQSIPIFREGGRFSSERYGQLLRSNRLSKQEFEAQQRRALLKQQLTKGVIGTAFLTPGELEEIVRLRRRKLELAYAVIPVDRYLDDVDVTDSEIEDYYETHKDEFMAPERVRLAYVKLDVRDIEQSIPVTEELLRQRYKEKKNSFYRPSVREAAHILIPVAEDADEQAVAEARKQAREVYTRIQAGESFAGLAREYSADAGSAAMGGELGPIHKDGAIDKAFSQALYNLDKVGAVAEPVRTQYGFHIIKLTGVQPGERKPFSEVRDVLAAEYRRREAEDLFYERYQTLEDLTAENPLSLEPAAKALGVEVKHTGWVSRDGASEGVASHRGVVDAAFSDAVLAGGNLKDALNSRPVELKRNDPTRVNPVVVVRVKAHEPSKLKSVDEVRNEIVARLRHQKAARKAREEAQALRSAAASGKPLADVARKHKLHVVEAGFVDRSNTVHPGAVVNKAFRMPKPTAGNPRYDLVELESGDTAIVGVTGLKEGDPESTPKEERQIVRRFLRELKGSSEFEAVVDAFRREAEIEIHEDQLARES